MGTGSKGIDNRYRVEFAQGGNGFICIDLNDGKIVKQGNLEEVTDWLDHQENTERMREKEKKKKPRRLLRMFKNATPTSLAASILCLQSMNMVL